MVFKRVDWLDDLGILVIRLMLGSVFTLHGIQKLFGYFDGPGLGVFAQSLEAWQVPYPAYAAVLWGAAEFLGGGALLTGYATRWMAAPLMLTMAGAGYLMYAHAALVPVGTLIVPAGIEYSLTVTMVLLGLTLTGPGKFVLHRWLPRPKKVVPKVIGAPPDQPLRRREPLPNEISERRVTA